MNVFCSGKYDGELHCYKISRNVSGKYRDSLAMDAVEFGAKKAQTKMILSADLASTNYKNEEICKSLGSLRQMRHEKLAFADFEKNDARDIEALKELTDTMPSTELDLTPSYITYIRTDAFMTSWGCVSQIDAFLQNKERVVSIDATGNLTRSWGPDSKRQFYYSIVYRSELTNSIIPLHQFISTQHDIANLSNCMSIFSRKLNLVSGRTNPIDTAVVDFSFALMNAISLSFNQCNLLLYIDMTYR